MLIGTTFNSLVWENPETLPFPEVVKPLLKNVKLDELHWNASGLPIHGAEYSISSNELYFIEAPNGEVQVQKIEFTGEFIIGTVFLNEDENEQSYFVTFRVTLFKGEVKEVILNKCEPQDTKDYKASISGFKESVMKRINRQSSWWYRWIYRPYMIIVRGIAVVICWILLGLRALVEKIALFLTPL